MFSDASMNFGVSDLWTLDWVSDHLLLEVEVYDWVSDHLLLEVEV